MRTCAGCFYDLPRSAYTASQYMKGKGVSRCSGCVHGHQIDTPARGVTNAGRYNRAGEAYFTDSSLANPIGEGSFRWVSSGYYTSGERAGQPCVVKWFKSFIDLEDEYYALDMKAVDRALELVNRFNDLHIIQKKIAINIPTVWRFDDDCPNGWGGHRALIEPYIEEYRKFNSNSGWYDDQMAWGEVMQALSHFSYFITGGQFLLCDLQGGLYQSTIILTDPAIISRTREYGVTDMGSEGILEFFGEHRCNQYCRDHWTKPSHVPQRYKTGVKRKGTKMMRHTVPTLHDKPRESGAY